MLKRLLATMLFLCLCSLCHGQANDVAFTVGGMSGPDVPFFRGALSCINPDPFQLCGSPIQTSSAVTYEGTFAHRIANLHIISFHLELPVLGTPTRTLKEGLLRQDFSSVFVTPGLRVKFTLPVISPFAVIGGGFAHFSSSASMTTIAIPASSNTTGAFDFGAGVDIKTPIPHLGLRGEFRQFQTGNSGFQSVSINHTDRFAGAGIVFKF